ncbi:glycosyltransferase family 9 protein [Skermanella stibiiresistens]|uniref:glycosyltransferase family 9 protein n=1 Tax=Skermanella stibiiresistens TaxID=913326 RepID=UPI0004B26DA3|nr:glycosyltransferase family 9 protein [Skermanella stibiiresistens]
MTVAEEILIIKLGALGDLFQAEGAIHDIRLRHPDARITLLTGPAYRRLMERCPWIDRIETDPRAPRWRLDKMLDLRHRLRSVPFAMVYDLQNVARTAFYRRWFLPRTPWSGTAPGCSHPHRAPNPKRIPSLERLAGQLADADVPVVHTPAPDLGWVAEDVSGILADADVVAPYVVLLPGSSARLPQKRWPGYAALAERLIARGVEVVTVPGPEELDLCRTIPGKTLTAGRWLNFTQLAGVLAGARLVIGNDSGPTHLAAHLGRPTVALFGSHMAARLTGIDRPWVTCVEVPDLAGLTVDRVERIVADHLDGE